jgi:hypothetical protein
MSLLDLHTEEMQAAAAQTNWGSPPPKNVDPATFHNFAKGTGRYFMRSMAEAGRSASMAMGAIPVVIDKVLGEDNYSGKPLADRYFQTHDEIFGRAVDYWTPKPEEVGAAGQVVGSLAGGVLQFVASPALAVANAQLSTSEGLVRQGVDVGAALVAGDIAGLGTVAGIALPTLGSNFAKRVATGVAGNLVQSVSIAAATQVVLKAADAPAQVVNQYDPLDERGRFVDVLMGAAFGVKAHIDARRAIVMTPTQRDATMVLNQARHLEESALPVPAVKPADLTSAVDATRRAMDQMLQGEPVNVGADVPLGWNDPKRSAQRDEIAQIVLEHTQANRTDPDFNGRAQDAERSHAEDVTAQNRATLGNEISQSVFESMQPQAPATNARTAINNVAQDVGFNPAALAAEASQLLSDGRSPGEVIGQLQAVGGKVSPELQNMLIGASEFGGRINDLVDQVTALKAQRGPNTQTFDVIAEAVENMRSGRTVDAIRPDALPVFDESLRMPTGEFDPITGEAIAVSANEYVARARSEAQTTKNTAKALFQTAADCLLGGL